MTDAPDPREAAQVTRLLRAWREGDEAAGDRVMGIVYDELRRIAAARMRGESPGHTLQSTALVHEAYVRLAGADLAWTDRKHFFATAARTMRRVLTDHARARGREKRGAGLDRITLAGVPAGDGDGEHVVAARLDMVALDAAIEALGELDPRKAAAVDLHYFAGLGYDEVAEALDISPATVHRDLRMARAWLRSRLG